MRALRVTINGGIPVVGGAADLGVLPLIVSCVSALGSDAQSPRGNDVESIKLSLGGLTSRGGGATDEHIDWLSQVPLKVGDRIEVELIETDSPEPIDHAELARRRETDTKEYHEHCKETYFKLRSHYEPEV
jgi:hypothetical protein